MCTIAIARDERPGPGCAGRAGVWSNPLASIAMRFQWRTAASAPPSPRIRSSAFETQKENGGKLGTMSNVTTCSVSDLFGITFWGKVDGTSIENERLPLPLVAPIGRTSNGCERATVRLPKGPKEIVVVPRIAGQDERERVRCRRRRPRG